MKEEARQRFPAEMGSFEITRDGERERGTEFKEMRGKEEIRGRETRVEFTREMEGARAEFEESEKETTREEENSRRDGGRERDTSGVSGGLREKKICPLVYPQRTRGRSLRLLRSAILCSSVAALTRCPW